MSSCCIDLTGAGVPEVNRPSLASIAEGGEESSGRRGPVLLDAGHANARAQMHYPHSPEEEPRGKCNFLKVPIPVDLARIHLILPDSQEDAPPITIACEATCVACGQEHMRSFATQVQIPPLTLTSQ